MLSMNTQFYIEIQPTTNTKPSFMNNKSTIKLYFNNQSIHNPS